MTVLVVDDDEEVRELHRLILVGAGYEVELAASGEEALQVTHRPDLALLDMMMPGIDGCETCRRLKARWPGLRVAFVTGSVLPQRKIDALGVDRSMVVTKPACGEQIIALVKGVA